MLLVNSVLGCIHRLMDGVRHRIIFALVLANLKVVDRLIERVFAVANKVVHALLGKVIYHHDRND